MKNQKQTGTQTNSCGLFAVCIITSLFVIDTTVAMQEYEKLKVLVAEIEMDIAKAEDGSSPAGTSMHMPAQGIKRPAQEVRCRVLEVRSATDKRDRKGPGKRLIECFRGYIASSYGKMFGPSPDGISTGASRMGLRKTKKYMKTLGRS